jgi:hypothetical protein
MPTFKRLQQKHPSAKMMWWQNGKLWNSRLDAQEAMLARGEIGRRKDPRQEDRGGRPFKPAGERYSDRAPRASERREERAPSGKLTWKPKSDDGSRPKAQKFAAEGRESRRSAKREGGPEWTPKGSFKPDRSARPEWKPKSSDRSRPKDQKFAAEGRESRRSAKREGGADWKPKSDWKPRGAAAPKRAWTPKTGGKLEWKPKGESTPGSRIPDPEPREKRAWVPKEEYKKSLGIEAKRDKNWRPGGEHKDPRQKYKDAKKAKWGRFKQTIRTRWESKGKKNGK